MNKKCDLTYTKEDLEKLLDNIPYEICLKNEDGKYIYVNKYALDKLELKKEDVIGKKNCELKDDFISKEWNEIDRRLLNGKEAEYSECTTCIDNKNVTYEVYKFSYEKSNSSEKLIGGVAKETSITKNFRNELQKLTDILHKKQLAKSNYKPLLKKTLNKLSKTLDFENIGIFLYDEEESNLKFTVESKNENKLFDENTVINVDKDMIYELKNDSKFEEILNERFNEQAGQNKSKYNECFKRIIKPIMFADRLIGVIYICSKKRKYYYEYEPFINEICKMLGVLLVNIQYVQDINKSIIKESQEKIDEMASVDLLKTNFLANISHEFRTPINIILSSTKLLLYIVDNMEADESQKEKLFKYLHMLKQNSYRLTRLVNNILDTSKIYSGFYDLKCGNHNIVYIIEDIVSSVAEYIKDNKRSIIFDTDEEEVMLSCDPDIIEKIILNLISNALKYTSENGNIEVEIKTDRKEEKLYVYLRNDGIKINKEEAEKIFGRFIQNEELLNRKIEGTGIGLFLVKALVEMHGGEIWVNTEKEDGAEFIFYIPIKEGENEYTKEGEINNYSSIIEKCDIEFSDIYFDS